MQITLLLCHLPHTSRKGYLDIVRWLCEYGGAAASVNGVPGVDTRSKGGWTPLMNAASKGHLPIVLYLLTKQSANPLVRNNWGETAYDASAAVFEIWICEVLSRFEAEQWRQSSITYDSLAVHTTVPLILYENQRLDTRLKTLAVSGGRPRFSPSGLGKGGRRPLFELKLLKSDEATGKKLVPAWRSAVLLPLREEPFKLPKPGARNVQSGAERSHFWLSDWTLDVTLPEVDAEMGWQYAQSFDHPDDQWTPEPPPQLERLLAGGTAVAALSASGSSGSSRSRPGSISVHSWVRRRRWVRVMKRRLDIPPLPFLGPDGEYYHCLHDGTMVPLEDTLNRFGDSEGQELSTVPSNPLASAQDYVARARYLAGPQVGDSEIVEQLDSAVEARRAIAKLERATTELRQGILSDDDLERKTQAEVLLNAYSRELERRRLAAGAQGLLLSTGDDDNTEEEDDDDDEFHYPGSSPQGSMRASSARRFSTDYFGRQPEPRRPTDLTPHLSQAPEFRVPTHEAPQKVVAPKYTPPTPHEVHARWERDHHVRNCRDCQRRFSFLLRRHHCRRCGRIFCDRCSSYRVPLDPSEIVQDPISPESSASTSSQRVCRSCYDAVSVTAPNRFRDSGVASMERIFVDQARLSVPNLSRETSSQLSDLAECPVCSQNLAELGPPARQEAHIKSCLDGGKGQSPQTAKYLVYPLPGESSLIGIECVICLEEFVEGSMVARLSCFCSFHNACLSSWLQRGKSCPIHARDP
ncbi:FYVE zinc finger-domain-containing protein [Russula compacta]|nr:FYVE zinc finger-domain-containing protein [Russula compacta]